MRSTPSNPWAPLALAAVIGLSASCGSDGKLSLANTTSSGRCTGRGYHVPRLYGRRGIHPGCGGAARHSARHDTDGFIFG
jgi:hypothetical protein